MIKKIMVLRQKNKDSEAYYQTFLYEMKSDSDTVATALRMLNMQDDLRDIDGKQVEPIKWECSCLQKKCGACAMRIGGRPRLACDAKLVEFGDVVKIEPLKKFPVVHDLVVNREILYENLKTLKLWLEKDSNLPEKKIALAFKASKCIQCGCCLEVCPNFYPKGTFFGMAAIGITTRLLSEISPKERAQIADLFDRHIYAGCGKSLACRKICPAGLDIDELLVNTVSMAIWKMK